MISIVRSRIVRMAALLAATLTLVVGLGAHTASASTTQVCGNGGSGYCLNDWGGRGASGDAIKMYYGGTTNDYFFVQKVNRCDGGDTVTSTAYNDPSNCPFADTMLDHDLRGYSIVQITYINNTTMCVASTGSYYAVLGSCADPLSGSGGAQGVIMVLSQQTGGYVFIDRYVSDQSGAQAFLTSGGNVGVQANYYGYYGETYWGGFQIFDP